MNRTEVALGISAIMLSLFTILAILAGVGRSTVMPGRYAWVDASRSLCFMVFLPILGIAVIVHGMRRSKTSEWLWGLILLLWSFFSWWWIPISIYDGSFFFKGGFAETFITTSWPLIVFIFQGIALKIDGACEKHTANTQSVVEFSRKPGISRLDANNTQEEKMVKYIIGLLPIPGTAVTTTSCKQRLPVLFSSALRLFSVNTP